jgi:hypothetical protein
MCVPRVTEKTRKRAGMCTQNSDTDAEPDVTCVTPSVLVANSHLKQGRGDECCTCSGDGHDLTHGHGICVSKQDYDEVADNICTRVMNSVGFQRGATADDCSAQKLCMEASKYVPTVIRPVCTAHGWLWRVWPAPHGTPRLLTGLLCYRYGCVYQFSETLELCVAKAAQSGNRVSTPGVTVTAVRPVTPTREAVATDVDDVRHPASAPHATWAVRTVPTEWSGRPGASTTVHLVCDRSRCRMLAQLVVLTPLLSTPLLC